MECSGGVEAEAPGHTRRTGCGVNRRSCPAARSQLTNTVHSRYGHGHAPKDNRNRNRRDTSKGLPLHEGQRWPKSPRSSGTEEELRMGPDLILTPACLNIQDVRATVTSCFSLDPTVELNLALDFKVK
ncbi:hypothetical protein AAFF_G00023810 [Aldrovandia affinis]|uniref:Uncharacterized protein n=1 Tax=Aldrovandia affinis TaxID=143900 RepID=A0AAD7T6G0_9TELE|nr:hypothetical protein AAFF_G00023810 [Aldrovandia affinis]